MICSARRSIRREIDFENEGGETYICGNPPYLGSKWQTDEQKSDLDLIFAARALGWKTLDYVSGWFLKAAEYAEQVPKQHRLSWQRTQFAKAQQVPICGRSLPSRPRDMLRTHES